VTVVVVVNMVVVVIQGVEFSKDLYGAVDNENIGIRWSVVCDLVVLIIIVLLRIVLI
jgi:hypothetical protein